MHVILIFEDSPTGLLDATFRDIVGPFATAQAAQSYLDEHPVLSEENGCFWKRAHIVKVRRSSKFLANSKQEWSRLQEDRKKYFGCNPRWMPSK